jgi:hypothetical protein
MTTLAVVLNPPVKPKNVSAKQVNAVPTRIMGPHGPQRLYSTTKFSGGQVYESPTHPGFAGSYNCDDCLQSVAGVYRVVGVVDRWLCAPCGGQKAARRAMAATYSASAAPKVGNVVTMPSRTPPRTSQERSRNV